MRLFNFSFTHPRMPRSLARIWEDAQRWTRDKAHTQAPKLPSVSKAVCLECSRRNARGVPDPQQVLGDARVGDEWVSLIGTQHPLPRAAKIRIKILHCFR